MKLLLSSDVHGNHEAYRWLAQEATTHSVSVVLAGDLLGCPDGYGSVEEAQRADAATMFSHLENCSMPVYYLWGNDDFVEATPESPKFRFLHQERLELGEWNLVGYQNSTPFVGGPHERPEEEIAAELANLAPLVNERTILVTHCPAYGVLDLGMLDQHAGSTSILKLVQSKSPHVHIHGHIHGAFGRSGRHFNVAASGACRGVLLDLGSLESEVLEGPEAAA